MYYEKKYALSKEVQRLWQNGHDLTEEIMQTKQGQAIANILRAQGMQIGYLYIAQKPGDNEPNLYVEIQHIA